MKTELLRFNGAVERDPAIDAWMKAAYAGGLGAIAHQWFEVMRKCGDEVRELLHDGCPVACLGDAPFGYVNVFTSHVQALLTGLSIQTTRELSRVSVPIENREANCRPFYGWCGNLVPTSGG
jgi:hypothetical protein